LISTVATLTGPPVAKNIIDKETKDILSKIISNNVNSDSLNYMILDVLDNIPESEKINELISELE